MEFELLLPDGLLFSERALERDAVTKELFFAPGPLITLCRFNRFDPTSTLTDEDLSCFLICRWY